jgi:hypothetical protein
MPLPGRGHRNRRHQSVARRGWCRRLRRPSSSRPVSPVGVTRNDRPASSAVERSPASTPARRVLIRSARTGEVRRRRRSGLAHPADSRPTGDRPCPVCGLDTVVCGPWAVGPKSRGELPQSRRGFQCLKTTRIGIKANVNRWLAAPAGGLREPTALQSGRPDLNRRPPAPKACGPGAFSLILGPFCWV